MGIDTSGYINAVGIVDGRKVLADVAFPARTDSLEQIVDNIDTVLKQADLTLKDVDGIGVGLGPGSWTGIRVGVTVGKMLAFAAGKPVAGISTLRALAYAAKNHSSLVCSIVSVGTGDAVYAGLYRVREGEIIREGDYFISSVPDLSTLIKETCVLVGTGVFAQAESMSRASGNNVIPLEKHPSGAAVAALAEKRLALGKCDDVLSLTPLYLKESTAKVFVDKYRSHKRTV